MGHRGVSLLVYQDEERSPLFGAPGVLAMPDLAASLGKVIEATAITATAPIRYLTLIAGFEFDPEVALHRNA